MCNSDDATAGAITDLIFEEVLKLFGGCLGRRDVKVCWIVGGDSRVGLILLDGDEKLAVDSGDGVGLLLFGESKLEFHGMMMDSVDFGCFGYRCCLWLD